MSRNVEIKARVCEPVALRTAVKGIVGGETPEVFLQTDTYFGFSRGRLKIREIDGANPRAELIFYSRPDSDLPVVSEYEVFQVENAEALKSALSKAHGVRAVVRKVREVYLTGDTRIHLDDVQGLGSFLEIEVMLTPGTTRYVGEKKVNELLAALHIEQESLVECSYCDLLERTGAA